ncbi:hypothetical protein UA75_14055 [Actinoalloteichus sp. GBA129-24]|uniref:Uncharacterized protein n=1 Tax=Actinoalloteichus fjordicus TaxID=1612552 RepID=A0AAC9LDT0_9PSEU|nr:hypothetical protein UA74_13970 [Actinoalloteichus fjordicus]APU20821.1 hypothetical protein UA75_14055 [Actinoalloteichus sp. GBA129-24]
MTSRPAALGCATRPHRVHDTGRNAVTRRVDLGAVRFRLRMNWLRRIMLTLTGSTPRSCRVDVGLHQVVIRAGRFFRTAFPLRSVSSVIVLPHHRVPGADAGPDGVRLLGARTALVQILLEAPAHARKLGKRIAVRRVTLSVDDPSLLMTVLSNRGHRRAGRRSVTP